MLEIRAAIATLVLAAVVLSGCTPGQEALPADPAVEGSSPSATPTPTHVSVTSEQPEPLIDADCSDFAGVASIGTIAGVTKRDPRSVPADNIDPVPLADVVVNAGGLACEFSDGGSWRTHVGDSFKLNEKWRGAAIFVVPNGKAAAARYTPDSYCGEGSTNVAITVCILDFIAGNAWVTVVISTNDKRQTLKAVKALVTSVVEKAAATAGPITRAPGTFLPPNDCETLISPTDMTAILGGPSASAEKALEISLVATTTYYTENVGCEWYTESQNDFFEAVIYPGGGWAADYTLSRLDAEAVTLAGAHDDDVAVVHCDEFAKYDFFVCAVEVIADGTWIRTIGDATTSARATELAVTSAEAILKLRQ